jgi:hypothetical protein
MSEAVEKKVEEVVEKKVEEVVKAEGGEPKEAGETASKKA